MEIAEPWWAHRQLGQCTHEFRIHEVLTNGNSDTAYDVDVVASRFHACIVCGERGFIELPKEGPKWAPDGIHSRSYWETTTYTSSPPEWAKVREVFARHVREFGRER